MLLGAIDNLADVQQLIRITDRHEPMLNSLKFIVIFSISTNIISNVVEEFALLADYQRISDGGSNFLLSKFGGMQEQRKPERTPP